MAIREREVKNKRNGNGVLTGRPGTVYDVNLKYFKNGVQKSYGKRGFATKKDAQQHEAEMRIKLQTPSYTNLQHNEAKQKLNVFLPAWVESYGSANLRPSTFASYRGHIKNQILPILGEVRLNELTPAMVDDMLHQLFEQNLAQNTVRYCQRILSVSLGCAVKYGYIETNPARNIITKFNRKTEVQYTPYSIAEVQMLLASVAATKWEFPVFMAVMYGLRMSEVLGLRWRNVDLVNQQLHVIEQLPYRLPPKTHTVTEMAPVKDRDMLKGRTLPITDSTMQYFEHQKAAQEQQKKMCGLSGKPYYDNDIVFCKPDGSPFRQQSMSNEFGQTLRRAELRHIRFHDLRHTAGTNIYNLTGDFYSVSEILGHTLEGTSSSLGLTVSLNTVTARYVSVREERKREVLTIYHNAVLCGVEPATQKAEQNDQ